MPAAPQTAGVACRTLLFGAVLTLLAGAALAKPPNAQRHPTLPSPSKGEDNKNFPPLGKGRAGVGSAPKALRLTPARIVLEGKYAEARVLVDGQDRAGAARDVSDQVALSTADPRIAVVDADGMVRARGDGKTTLTARLGGRLARVPVVVRGVAKAGPPRFLTDVIPVLTRAGCNQGACHGAASGKGGFKLSLLGYDPDSDYEAITRANGARRVAPAQPDNSLFLRKPTLGVAHRGGKRFDVGSPEYRLLRAWIAGGMPAPAAKEPRVTRLEVIPAVRTLALGQTQRFVVRAHYSDGSQRDATGQTLFGASDGTVVEVSPDGEARVVGPGEGAVVIRYQGLVAIARVVSPFGPPRHPATGSITADRGAGRTQAVAGSAATGPDAALAADAQNLDRLEQAKLDTLGLDASGPSTDADFLRRATLDVIGQLPTPDEARAFLASRDPQKREKLIDALLARPEYIDFWTLQWGDILRSSRTVLPEKGMYAFHYWIRQCVAENRPWDRFAQDLLLARGSDYEDGAANFYRTATTPQDLAETTAQVFLGVRIQCARCHNHPYDKWTQNQYYQMAAFFARVKAKNGQRPAEKIIFPTDGGEVVQPRTHQEMTPCALDAAPLAKDYTGDRREALAAWLTSPQNPFFAHVIVNRIWSHFMGRGLVEPVDDLRVTNPPSNAALFDWLAQDFVRHGYDLKYLMRVILRSHTYQRSAEPTRTNARDTRYYAHFPFKRLEAEPLLDALCAVTGVPETFAGYPAGMRAEQLPDTTVSSYFLDLFGRPARNTSCACERTDAPNLGQVLHFMNSADINARLAAKTGRIATLMAAKLPDSKVVEELYLAAYARYPTPAESRKGVQTLASAKNRQQATEDLLWVLLNTKEFLFNH